MSGKKETFMKHCKTVGFLINLTKNCRKKKFLCNWQQALFYP